MKRFIEPLVRKDLERKMVFLAGPRQVGKTTLAKRVLEGHTGGLYLSWDNRLDRKKILKAEWPAESTLVILDELHKYARWKRWIKGEFDQHRQRLRFLVTGSARLDIYRRGGDSLQGRYHYWRLHPFSAGELFGVRDVAIPGEALRFPDQWKRDNLENLLRFSGFPEPILAQDETEHRRWQKERLDRFFREDIRDLENVRELSQLELLADLLASKAGGRISLNALREDIEVSHKAVTRWMDILERLYYCFRVRPFAVKLARSLKKEPKLYLWDWSLVPSPGERFENLVASHLLKFVHFLQDSGGYDAQLYYLRDAAGHEADFLVTIARKPWFVLEVKTSAQEASRHLAYFAARLRIPYVYQIHLEGSQDYLKDNIRVLPAARFLAALP